VAQWESALRAVAYSNGSASPSTADRTVSFLVNDGQSTSTVAVHRMRVAAATTTSTGTGSSTDLSTPAPAPAPVPAHAPAPAASTDSTGSVDRQPGTSAARTLPPVLDTSANAATSPHAFEPPSELPQLIAANVRIDTTPLSIRTDASLSFDFASSATQQLLVASTPESTALFVTNGESRRHGITGEGAAEGQEDSRRAETTYERIQWAVAAAATISMSWGFLRLAGLAATALASRPVWQHIDPIPLLNDDDESHLDPAQARHDNESEEDEFAARDLLDQMRAHEA